MISLYSPFEPSLDLVRDRRTLKLLLLTGWRHPLRLCRSLNLAVLLATIRGLRVDRIFGVAPPLTAR